MVIDRVIGRLLAFNNPIGAWLDREIQSWSMGFLLRLSDHRDNFWVASPSPLPLVCSAVDRSWMLNHTLEPKGFLRAEFEGILNIADPAGFTTARAVLGFVGYRRIG
jgi:hypothetical protein